MLVDRSSAGHPGRNWPPEENDGYCRCCRRSRGEESASENLRYLWTIGKRRQTRTTCYDVDDDCEDKSLSEAGESRGAVALTVVWMLTFMSTAAAMLVVLLLRLVMAILPVAWAACRP